MSLYVGRFAPTPSGRLHLGSLVAALASYLDARAHGGRWLLRLEDVDLPRRRQDYVDDIRYRLEALHLYWDEERHQSQHLSAYETALEALHPHLYRCDCSRQSWQKSASVGELGAIYPRYCRHQEKQEGAWRLALPELNLHVDDRFQGVQNYALSALGDPVLRRRDGIFMYVLSCAVDDALQGVSHVVRGADLLPLTAIQKQLQALLGYPSPRYAHVPLMLDENGHKLSKSASATAFKPDGHSLRLALAHLGMPIEHDSPHPEDVLNEALQQWRWRVLCS